MSDDDVFDVIDQVAGPLADSPEPTVSVPMTLLELAEASLVQDAENARIHTPENLDAIGFSLDEVGGARSIVIDEDNKIWCGNGTVREALKRGMKLLVIDRPSKDTLVAVRVTGLSDREKKRMALWDNRSAELARWNRRVLKKLAAPDQQLLDGLFDDDTLAELKGEQEKMRERGFGSAALYECPSCGAQFNNPKPPRTRAPQEASTVQTTLEP
jgi:hypothetical protein